MARLGFPRRTKTASHGSVFLVHLLHMILFLWFVALAESSTTPRYEIRELTRLLEARYREPYTLSARFLERYSEDERVLRTEAGTVYFRRPGRMRWEYESPERNLFLVDGKTAWFYVPADHTVTKIPAKKSEDWRTPLALLAGEMKVSRICKSVQIDEGTQPEDATLVWLRCDLRGVDKVNGDEQGSGAQLVQFELVRATGELKRIVIHDRARVTVELEFSHWEFNPPMDERMFRFEPPKGVAIVDGDLGSSGRSRGQQ
jgi:outer membrane lipoprotein carrier protein